MTRTNRAVILQLALAVAYFVFISLTCRRMHSAPLPILCSPTRVWWWVVGEFVFKSGVRSHGLQEVLRRWIAEGRRPKVTFVSKLKGDTNDYLFVTLFPFQK